MTAAPASPLLERSADRSPVFGGTASDHARGAVTVMEARRSGNAELRGLVTERRCECALPDCRETFPAVAESYRGTADRFIVVPAHLGVVVTAATIDDGRVVRAADRFFVVELNGNGGRSPAPARGGADRGRLHSVWSTTTSRPRKKT